jgi:hypothetical protein
MVICCFMRLLRRRYKRLFVVSTQHGTIPSFIRRTFFNNDRELFAAFSGIAGIYPQIRRQSDADNAQKVQKTHSEVPGFITGFRYMRWPYWGKSGCSATG